MKQFPEAAVVYFEARYIDIDMNGFENRHQADRRGMRHIVDLLHLHEFDRVENRKIAYRSSIVLYPSGRRIDDEHVRLPTLELYAVLPQCLVTR